METSYRLFQEESGITVFSKHSIPFSISTRSPNWDEQRRFKAALKAAIQSITVQPGRILCAAYGTSCPTQSFFDVENILFYNIGNALFRPLAKEGLAFSLLHEAAVTDLQKTYAVPSTFCHCYQYHLLPPESEEIATESVLATWDPLPFCKLSGLTATACWKAVKAVQNDIRVINRIDCNQGHPFGIDLHLELPSNVSLNLTTTVKPLLDGIISAFHGADQMDLDLPYLCEKLRCPADWLIQNPCDILGKRKYVAPYRQNVKWNPADDLCKRVRLTVTNNRSWRISGTAYQID